jgi:dihydropteroate synthase
MAGYTLDCRGTLIALDRPRIMGILNVTDDSFYKGSRTPGVNAALEKAEEMLREGADFLDVGGQSTRPASRALDASEETDRVLPVIEALVRRFPEARVSVDTYHSGVARAAVAAGACMVNDVSAGHMDPDMLPVVGALRVPYVAMHMRGTPQTMQQDTYYEDITQSVIRYLADANRKATDNGVLDVLIDPGLGFGKTVADNFRLLYQLDLLALVGRPIVVGLSRKSMVYKTLGTTPEQALNGTTALHMAALLKGVHILRVHDVAPALEVVRLAAALQGIIVPVV